MYRINKLDYFVGVFLSTILNSSKGVPALFDQTDNSKRIEFATNLGDFNVFVKYSTGLKNICKNINGQIKNKMYCNVSFSKRDYELLKNLFFNKDKINIICLVCTSKELNETKLVALTYENGMKCLNKSTNGGNRRITVTRIGSEHNFYCYGVGFNKNNYIETPVDCTKFLGITEEN